MQALWSGTISFGLIHIPIKLYNATNEGRMRLRLLRRKDACPIKYVKVCRFTGEEVAPREIVKGYEYQKGDYIFLEEEDFRRASPEKTRTIEVLHFVDRKNVGEELFIKPYYTQPDKKAEKAYVLLRDALNKSKKIGIAKFVIKDKEHLAAIIPKGDMIMVELIRFKEDLKEKEELNLPRKSQYLKKELDIAVQLIAQLTESFKYGEYRDAYSEELEKVVASKAKGKEYHHQRETAEYSPEVMDIMDKLKKSLEEARQKRT